MKTADLKLRKGTDVFDRVRHQDVGQQQHEYLHFLAEIIFIIIIITIIIITIIIITIIIITSVIIIIIILIFIIIIIMVIAINYYL